MNDLEIVTDRKQILALAGQSLYESELEEKLPSYKSIDLKSRKHWSSKDLDIYIRKIVSTRIVNNEFKVQSPGNKKPARVKNDKDMIVILAEELNMGIMSIKFIYNEIKGQLALTDSKDDVRNFLSAQIYAQIDELDLEIMSSETERDKQKWYELKMKAMDQLAKIKNLEEKQSNNTAIVHGNVNTQTNTTVDKQIVVTEQQAMLNLINKLLPGK